MAEKTTEPIFLRQNLIFLVYRLFIAQIIFIGTYILLDLPVLLLMDGDTSTPQIEVQADWYAITLLTILSLVQMIIIVIIVLRWYNSYCEIREDDIIERHGFISTRENTHSYRNFSAISISQGVIGRIFNFGNVKLFNPALDHKLVIKRVSSPTRYMKLLSERLPKTNESVLFTNKK